MKSAIAALAILAPSASAFQIGKASSSKTSLEAASMNGWVPDANKFAYGLPGSLDPVPDFDPLNFAETADLNLMKQYREAELQHGRVAMLAVIGFLVTEEPIEFHPLFQAGNKDIGPAIRHLDEVRAVAPVFFEILAVVIGALELNRALIGWTAPTGENKPALNADYFPGDVGFDPLGLRPSDPAEFLELHTKELQNGRLAMLGAAGIVAQELVNGKEIFVNLGFAEDRFDPSTLPIQF
ncbi:hypothetical protein ACA910_001536 [Epithemia clementina (nom. ined.)]